MKYICSCGHELRPADAAEPLAAVSTGLCARCMAHMLRAREPFPYTVRVDGYELRLTVLPARVGFPHVSADSPGYLRPGHPMRLLGVRVYEAGTSSEVELAPAHRADLIYTACTRANVPLPAGIPAHLPAHRQLRLPLRGLLATAFERTGRAE